MIDPQNPADLRRLIDAFNASYRLLRQTRERRISALRQYVGFHYSDRGAPKPLPVNQLMLVVDVLVNHLAARTPAVSIATPIRELKASAFSLELDVNQVLKEMHFKRPLRRTIKEAMFGPGVMKIGIAETQRGFDEDAGQLYAETIDADDWCQDMGVRVYEHSRFVGHGTVDDIDDVIDDPSYPEDYRRDLREGNEGGDNRQFDQTAQSIGTPQDAISNRDPERRAEHWHIWLCRERQVITVPRRRNAEDAAEARLLKQVEWTGPRTGPFKVMSYTEVPGNIRPLTLASKIRDVHDLRNDVFRRMGEDAVAAKSVLAYEGSASKDVDNIAKTPNGSSCKVEHLDKMQQMRLRGVDQSDMAFSEVLHQVANIFSGNPESLAGLAPQADTLGQERIITESASEQIRAMQDSVSDLVLDAVQDIAWYEITNPLLERLVERRIPGTAHSFTSRITPERLGPLADRFLELNFTIQPYSTQPRSPAESFAAFERVFDKFVAPYIDQQAQAGIGPNWEGIIRTAGRALGITELVEDCMAFSQPPTLPMQETRGQDPRTRPHVDNTRQMKVSAPQRPQGINVVANLMKGAAQQQPAGVGG